MSPVTFLLLLSLQSVPGPPAAKIGVVYTQVAIVSTKEGKQAADRLRMQWAPEDARQRKQQADIDAERERFGRESLRRSRWWPWRHALSARRRAEWKAAMDLKQKNLRRQQEDARAGVQHEQERIVGGIGRRLSTLIEKYAREKGYSAILDGGAEGSPVKFASDDVTSDLIRLYDETYPAPARSASR